MQDMFQNFDAEMLYSLAIGLAVVFIIGHMLYVLIKPKKFGSAFSADEFRSQRKMAQMPEESSEEENQQSWELLQIIFNTYTWVSEDEEGEELRKPRKMKEIVKASQLMEQLIELKPTDEEVVAMMNEHREVIRSNVKRSFDGSTRLIWMGVLVAVILALFTLIEGANFFRSFATWGAFFWGPAIIYFIASLTPQFLIEKRASRGGGNLASGCAGIAFGILGSGETVRYKYSDGTTEDDNSSHVWALVFGIIAMFIFAITISLWALVNYFRNYVFYI